LHAEQQRNLYPDYTCHCLLNVSTGAGMGATEVGVVGRTVYRHLLRRCAAAVRPSCVVCAYIVCCCCMRIPLGVQIGRVNAWLAVRSAALFDKQPVLKALIGPDFVKLPKPLEAVVNVFLSGASLYVPAPLLPRSVAQAVRDAFRFPVRLGHTASDEHRVDGACSGARVPAAQDERPAGCTPLMQSVPTACASCAAASATYIEGLDWVGGARV